MSERNKNNSERNVENNYSGKQFGSQGVDKAPGEEAAGNSKNVVQETQKGKGKVDGDPTQKSDQPATEE